MGFQVYRAPDVDTDENNFGCLNIPPHHPARDMWDTFHTTSPGVLLRTHTSPGQVRVMRERCPEPIRVILPGMCYRYEQTSARSEIQFNQVEVLAVGEGITFGEFKGTLQSILPAACTARTSAPACALPISHSPSPVPRWMLNVLSAAARAAPSAREPAGWRSWVAVWSTRWSCRTAATIL